MADHNPFVVNITADTTTAIHHLLANYFPKTYTGKELYSHICNLCVKHTPLPFIESINNLYDLTITKGETLGEYQLKGTCKWGFPDVKTIGKLLQPMKKDCLEISLEYVEEHRLYVVAPK